MHTETKVKSRGWMLGVCQKVFGPKLPSDLQYWSLAGNMVGDNGKIHPECELSQITRSGFLKPSQFRCAELNDARYQGNLKALQQDPKLKAAKIWNLRLDQAMGSVKSLRPGVVNIDTQNEVPLAVTQLARVHRRMQFNPLDRQLIFLNIVMEGWHEKADDRTFVRRLRDSYEVSCMMQAKWRVAEEPVQYQNSSKTTMRTYVFVRGVRSNKNFKLRKVVW